MGHKVLSDSKVLKRGQRVRNAGRKKEMQLGKLEFVPGGHWVGDCTGCECFLASLSDNTYYGLLKTFEHDTTWRNIVTYLCLSVYYGVAYTVYAML